MKNCSLLLLVLIAFAAAAQNADNFKTRPYKPASQELFNEIAHMDSVMFNAFNEQNLEKLKATFSDSLEFYHDKGGKAALYNPWIILKACSKKIKPPASAGIWCLAAWRFIPLKILAQ